MPDNTEHIRRTEQNRNNVSFWISPDDERFGGYAKYVYKHWKAIGGNPFLDKKRSELLGNQAGVKRDYVVIYDSGMRIYYNKRAQAHRTDGPAIEKPCGTKVYFQDGLLHREDGPAVERPDGSFEYYVRGFLHRVDGPALRIQRTEHWCINGKLHRNGGPASEFESGAKIWYQNGEKHRIGAPAEIDESGTETWFHHGKIHMIDGPAKIFKSGHQEWYKNDVLHRLDGPAAVCVNGKKKWNAWFQNGVLHRLDGPAEEFEDGTVAYHLFGKEMEKKEFEIAIKRFLESKAD